MRVQKSKLLRNLLILLLLVAVAALAGKAVGRWRASTRTEPVQNQEKAAVSEYSPGMVYVVEQLRTNTGLVRGSVDADGKVTPPLPFIGGSSVGFAGRPGAFFLLVSYCEQMAQENDIALMLRDKSPVVRVMAAHIVLRRVNLWGSKFGLSSLEDDLEKVEVAPGGCVIYQMTVGELVKRMREAPDYFGEGWYEQQKIENAKKE